MGRPGKGHTHPGQPSVIDRVIDTDEAGQVTVADKILRSVRAGVPLVRAAAAAGINTKTIYDWLRVGAKYSERRALAETSKLPVPAPTQHEDRCVQFSNELEIAEAEWEVRQNVILEQLGRGGVIVEETTVVMEKRGNQLVEKERRTKTTKTLPDPRVIQWRLERKFPDRYGTRIGVDVESFGSREERPARAQELGDMLAEHQAAKAAAIEAGAVEVAFDDEDSMA